MSYALLPLREMAQAPRPLAEVGGKALRLAQLIAAGLPVPDGFVVPAGALGRAPGLADEIRTAAAALGPVVIARSSSTAEDRTDGAAPGLFSSRTDIEPGDAAAAAAEVIASAALPGVLAYLSRHGVAAEVPAVAVVIQRQVGSAAGRRGVLYTRPPGRPDAEEVLIEATGGASDLPLSATARRDDGFVVGADPALGLGSRQVAELVRLALAAEHAIGAERGADVEWVIDGAELWLVQARPVVHPPRPRADPQLAVDIAFSRARPARVWRWDAAHNPDPLSPAQAGLVALVGDLSPEELRVVGGYLYHSARDEPRGHDAGPLDAAGLEALYRRDVLPAAERMLATVEGAAAPSLEEALAIYREIYYLHSAVLGPALSRARREGGRRPAAESAVARALEAGPEAVAALAAAWDVAAPSFAESGDLVARARERWSALRASRSGGATVAAHAGESLAATASAIPSPAHAGESLAATASAIAESDDFLFYRAQQVVRRAMFALAERWRLGAPEDIFFVPFNQVRTAARRGGVIDPDAARGAAAAARLERAAARTRAMPLAFRDGRAIEPARALASSLIAAGAWRGTPASPGSARGAATRVDDLGVIDGDIAGRVVVARTITPATLVQIVGAAALVCEQGGALDHAAALARELRLPCVVGCGSSARTIVTGDELLVDGDAGLVIRLGPQAAGA